MASHEQDRETRRQDEHGADVFVPVLVGTSIIGDVYGTPGKERQVDDPVAVGSAAPLSRCILLYLPLLSSASCLS